MTARRLIRVFGLAQGVGFRPFTHRLACSLGLVGYVRNDGSHVCIEVEGRLDALDAFRAALEHEAPVLARIDRLETLDLPPRGDAAFVIAASTFEAPGDPAIPADVATCADCLRELFDPADRRYRYPFINCTNCGPRFTIIDALPYDRVRTTMAAFELCVDCRHEYEDPADRRFHAEPIACPACGPRLSLLSADGVPIATPDPLSAAADLLLAGRIVAIKGLGGYHLACRADDDRAVAELRRRKHREERPFAVLARDLDAARELCEVSSCDARLLESPAKPIVLMPRRRELHAAAVASGVAPGVSQLGLMLPYSPLHHLLMDVSGMRPIVLTSGNRSDEPIAYDDADALRQLRGIADAFLTHNRGIIRRCDDSVVRSGGHAPELLRRSRGYAPHPIAIAPTCPVPILAVGGQLKVTFSLASGDQAVLSAHCGDLDDLSAFEAYGRAIDQLQRLLRFEPRCIAHDLHPDYASTRFAHMRAASAEHAGRPIALVAVQHHHAHLAACLTEHRLAGPAIGVIFDGTGYGLDGAIWGGEFLIGDCHGFRRAAHLRSVPMPGGEQAIRQPWRMAVAHLLDADAGNPMLERLARPMELRIVRRMLAAKINAPLTSSAGRFFDAVAALVGVRREVSYEGQAAIELENIAERAMPDGQYPWRLAPERSASAGDPVPLIVDTRPLISAVADDALAGMDTARIARRFHESLVTIVVSTCRELRRASGVGRVVLSGGVFMNRLLAESAADRLTTERFDVLRPRLAPANDGGLSLGQAAIAAARLVGDGEAQADVPGHSGANH